MRTLAPLFCLAACAADPVLLPDAGPCASACGAGTTCVGGICVAIDAGAPDVPAVDVGEEFPTIVDPAPDSGPRGADVQLADGGRDAVAVGDAGSDVPADVRVSCNEKAALRCTSHEQCAAMCLPAMDDHPWCCAGIECRPYALAASCPPR